jgi:peptidyl-tRNA hydrolase
MPVVIRVEKRHPPTTTAVCEAAAMAVVRLLADERAQEGGPWWQAVRRWEDGRIRKVVRRARGARWQAVQALDGVTVSHDAAEARAFPPRPTDALPPELAKLQVSGTDLEDPHARPWADVVGTEVVIAITPSPPMSTGKMAAQCGHASQLAWRAMGAKRREQWARDGFPVMVRRPDARGWRAARTAAMVAVHDGGFTEVEPGTLTAVVVWREDL